MLFILRTLVQKRKLILWTGFLTAVVMAGVSLILPIWYQADTSVFPPEPNQYGTASTELLAALQVPVLGPSAVGVSPSTIYMDILRSRRVGQRIIAEFNLKEVFNKEVTSKALDVLHKRTNYELVENGLLILRYEDRNPERAAAIANRYIELLDEFNRQLNVTRASKTRQFIEGQIDLHAAELQAAEEALRQFQEEHEALELDAQIASVINVVSTLTADAIALEVDMEILRQYTSTNSQEYVRNKKRYDEILRQLEKFKIGSTRSDKDLVRSYFPTFERIPEVSLELARRIRRVQVEEKVYGLLVEEYEKSRIEEARDTPTVQILDPATVPEIKSRPKRTFLVIVAAVIGTGWSALMVLFVAAWREEGPQGEALKAVLGPFLSDLGRPFRRKRR